MLVSGRVDPFLFGAFSMWPMFSGAMYVSFRECRYATRWLPKQVPFHNGHSKVMMNHSPT